MKSELAGHLDKARDTVTEVGRIVSSRRYPDDRRTTFVKGLLATMTQYHQSALELLKSGAVASSCALIRDLVRDMRYGLWINSCATEEQILRLEKGEEFPLGIPEMTKEVEAAYSADPFFVRLKNRWGPQLTKYSLARVFQLGRWATAASSGLHHDDEEIRDVTTIATVCIMLLAAKFLARQKQSVNCKQIEALAASYDS
jgi:hypothetical protein